MNLPFAKKTNLFPAARQASWYTLRTHTQGKHADIYLYGVVGGWRVNVNHFLDDLRSAGEVESITVYLNTIGGTFYDGLPIYNTLKQHKAHVTVKVMGYALSMGSVIMLAADDVQAAENAIIMIHGAQGIVWGDAREMRHQAEILETHESAIIPEYMRRMGKSEQDVKALLEKETWFNATQAQAIGLVNTITDRVDLEEAEQHLADDSWEFAANHFHNPPEGFAARFQAHWSEAQRKNQPWLKRIINQAVGDPAPLLYTPNEPEQDELEMTREERQELAALVGTAVAEAQKPLLEVLKPQEQPTQEAQNENTDDPGQDALKAENERLKAALLTEQQNLENKDQRIADLEAEMKDYKMPDPNKNTPNVPENTGPEDEWSKYGY